jgi:hypothetical protein
MVQSYRFDYNVRLDAKTFEFLSCYMSYLASNLRFNLKNCMKNEVSTNRELLCGKCNPWT